MYWVKTNKMYGSNFTEVEGFENAWKILLFKDRIECFKQLYIFGKAKFTEKNRKQEINVDPLVLFSSECNDKGSARAIPAIRCFFIGAAFPCFARPLAWSQITRELLGLKPASTRNAGIAGRSLTCCSAMPALKLDFLFNVS